MGGTVYFNTDQTHVKGYITWTEQNINNTNNTSDVYVEMRMYRDNTGYTTYGTGNFYMTVNGTGVNHTSESYSITYNSDTLVDSGTVTVPHNSDGTKTITISYSGNGDSPFTITAGSFNATLSNIPRQSTVSSSVDWTAGINNLSVSLATYSSAYHHTLTLEAQRPDGSWSVIATRTNIGASTTIVFTQAENTIAYQILAGYEYRSSMLYVDTYDSSGNHIGSQSSKGGTLYGATIAKMQSPSSANIGDSFNATVGPCYTGFTYTAVFTFGSFTKTFPITVGTSGSNVSVPISFTTGEQATQYQQIPNANSGVGNFQITSQYNGVDVNDGYPRPAEDPNWTFNLNIVTGSSNPTFGNTYGYEDINNTTKGATGNNQYIVQGQSTLQVDFHNTDVATPVNYSTISYYLATIDSTSVRKDVPGAAPSLGISANAGSTLGISNYYVKFTWVSANGESLPSPEATYNVTATGNNLVVTLPTFPSGVTSAKIYVSTTSGTETYQGSTTGTSYTLSANPTTNGATAPTMMTFSMGTVNSSQNTPLKIQAVDSRGNSTSTSITITVLPYSTPVVTTTAARENGFQANTDITLSGTFSTLNNTNSLQTVQYAYKLTTDTNYTVPTPNFTYTTSSGTYSATQVVLSLDQTLAWNVKITVADKLSTSVVNITVGKGIPAAFIDEAMNTLSVGMLPAHSNAIEVAGSFYESGTLIQDKYAPSGSVNMFAGASAPSGYLICDGSAVSRTTYAKLFGVIGTAYGTGDGSTTFNLPNLCGRTPVGVYSADTDFNAVGKTGGEKTHFLTTNEMPSHSHQTVATAGYSFFGGASGNPAQGTGYGTAANTLRTDSQGGGYAHNNMQPYTTINFIIKT